MKILLVADREEETLWGTWSEEIVNNLKDVDIILSAGDLSAYYLEFLADNINAPVVYVPGNHDGGYINRSPYKCINTDERMTEFSSAGGGKSKSVRMFGIGGSMRYKDGPYQYSEEEQSYRVQKIMKIARGKKSTGNSCVDILLTHAPCKGYGDLQDVPHRGYECFNEFLYEIKPQIHCYGHIHQEYNPIRSQCGGMGYQRLIKHPSGTNLINGSGFCFIIV